MGVVNILEDIIEVLLVTINGFDGVTLMISQHWMIEMVRCSSSEAQGK